MAGGVEWYIFNISRELTRLGVEVYIFTTEEGSSRRPPFSPEVIEDIHIKRFKTPLNLSYRLKSWKGLREELVDGGFDLIHLFDYPQYHTKIGVDVARKLGIPSVVTVFDVHSMVPRPFFKQLPMDLFDAVFAGQVLNAASKVLVRAPQLVKRLEQLGVDPSRMNVTPSGVRREELAEVSEEIFREKYSTGKHVVLYLGRLHPMKGPQYLVRALPVILREVPDTTLVLVGPDHQGFRRHLEKTVEELGISENVVFTGPIYETLEKMQAYASCNVFCLPSGYEGTSQSIFQAMAQGKPVVATDSGGIPFQVSHGVEGMLVPYGDPTSLSKSILTLLKDPCLADRMGAAAKKKAEGFCYDRLGEQMKGIYDELLGSTSKRGDGRLSI
jgi:glycosyltransferase involved in cell wall biosynthesis